jgi:outer membrane protein
MTPRHPGSDDLQPSAMVNLDIARGDTPFRFEAPDDSFGIDLVRSGGLSLAPVANFEDSRTAKDVGTDLPKVGFSLELGGAVRFQPSESCARASAGTKAGSERPAPTSSCATATAGWPRSARA